jgi:hypothetical protein
MKRARYEVKPSGIYFAIPKTPEAEQLWKDYKAEHPHVRVGTLVEYSDKLECTFAGSTIQAHAAKEWMNKRLK